MTATQLQQIATRLANNGWCRYWLDWRELNPPLMAISCIDENGNPQRIADAESHGLLIEDPVRLIYTVPRTNDDGKPYIPLLR